jgi:hypothetical protein
VQPSLPRIALERGTINLRKSTRKSASQKDKHICNIKCLITGWGGRIRTSAWRNLRCLTDLPCSRTGRCIRRRNSSLWHPRRLDPNARRDTPLSFAQFEREGIGERIRDKIAASKRKCGGCLLLALQSQSFEHAAIFRVELRSSPVATPNPDSGPGAGRRSADDHRFSYSRKTYGIMPQALGIARGSTLNALRSCRRQ